MKRFAKKFGEIIDSKVGRTPEKTFKNYRELAEKAGVSPSAISQYKLAKSKEPRFSILDKISIALGFNKEYLRDLWLEYNDGTKKANDAEKKLSSKQIEILNIFDSVDNSNQDLLLEIGRKLPRTKRK